MNDKRKIEINIVEFQTYKILIQINSNVYSIIKIKTDTMLICIGFLLTEISIYNVLFLTYSLVLRM